MLTDTHSKTFGFVVLHYLAYDMTKECVEGLLNNFGEYDIHIALVDNASSNGSGQSLAKYYKDTPQVTVIVNSENLGFANGNNVGYRYLKDKYKCSYIIVMNNDVLIEQRGFLDEIDALYAETNYAVLGPDIYCPTIKDHQNPAHENGFSYEEVLKLHKIKIKRCKHPLYSYICQTLSVVKHRLTNNRRDKEQKSTYLEEQEGVVLQGACYIFSELFLAKRYNCFNPETFLYMEEDILHYECQKAGLPMVYSPTVKVIHMEDIATNMSMKSGYKKCKFKENEMRKSINIMLSIMENDS